MNSFGSSPANDHTYSFIQSNPSTNSDNLVIFLKLAEARALWCDKADKQARLGCRHTPAEIHHDAMILEYDADSDALGEKAGGPGWYWRIGSIAGSWGHSSK